MNQHNQWLFEVPPTLEAIQHSTKGSVAWENGEWLGEIQSGATRRPIRSSPQPIRRTRLTIGGTVQPTQSTVNSGATPLTDAHVRSNRIDVFAQKALLRMSKNPSMRADAAGMVAAVKAGKLGGIYKEDEQVPALRARKMNSSWWKLIPAGENAILFLDPVQPKTGIPILVFRDRARSDSATLDPALQKAWRAYLLWRKGEIIPVDPRVPSSHFEVGRAAGSVSCKQVIGSVVPRSSCAVAPPKPKTTNIVIAYGSGFANPWGGGKGEIEAARTGVWFPSSDDFRVTAQQAKSKPQDPVQGIKSFDELLSFIKRQPKASIRKLILIGHGSENGIGFRGEILNGMPTKTCAGNYGVCIPEKPAITVDTISAKAATINSLKDRFIEGAEIIICSCNAGANPKILEDLSRVFGVCVRGFIGQICWCFTHNNINQIRVRGRVKYPPGPQLDSKCSPAIANPDDPLPIYATVDCLKDFQADINKLLPDNCVPGKCTPCNKTKNLRAAFASSRSI